MRLAVVLSVVIAGLFVLSIVFVHDARCGVRWVCLPQVNLSLYNIINMPVNYMRPKVPSKCFSDASCSLQRPPAHGGVGRLAAAHAR